MTLAFEQEVAGGFVGEGSKISVRVFADDRLIPYLRRQLRASSVDRHEQRLRRHVFPKIGARMLTDVKPSHVQLLLDDAGKADNGRGGTVSEQTVRGVRDTLSALFGQAVRWQLLPTSPVTHIRPPRAQRREMRALDRAEARKLTGAAAGHRVFEALVPFAIGTGMRRGELLGLRWSDVDLERGTARIARSLGPDGTTLSEPKTAAGRREIALGTTLLDALRAHRDRQLQELVKLANGDEIAARKLQREGYVFATERGTPIKARRFENAFGAIVTAAELGPLRFHDLRHTCASLLLEAGIPVPTVARLLGHASPSITMTVYAHMIRGSEERAAAALEAALAGP